MTSFTITKVETQLLKQCYTCNMKQLQRYDNPDQLINPNLYKQGTILRKVPERAEMRQSSEVIS